MYKKIFRNICLLSAALIFIISAAVVVLCCKNAVAENIRYLLLETVVFDLIVFGVSVYAAKKIAKKIVEPVEKMYDFNNTDEAYEEIKPFLNKISRQNKRIKRQMEEIDQTGQIRREFSANVSHELKTPLTAIHGYAQLIKHKMAKEEDIPEFINKIEHESNRLINLVEDIMKLSKLDENIGEDDRSTVDIKQIAEEVKLNLEETAAKNNITITVEGEPLMVYANRSQMMELVYNLCENAVKYNRENGKVVIKTENSRLYVRDTGIGIPEEYQGRIFERFFRVDKSHSKKVSGTGLGLSIVKHIVMLNKFEIKLKSIPDEGSEFKVTFRK